MGLRLFSCGDDSAPNPNKYRFTIVRIEEGDIYDIALVKYPDCLEYQSLKVLLVVKGSVTMDMKELDPHFFKDSFIVGRFAPTDEGIGLARFIQESATIIRR